MKKLLLIALNATVLFTACKKDDDNKGPDPSKTRVMFMHTTLSADTIRVKANDTIVVNTLAPFASTGYVNLTPGSNALSFVFAQTGLPLKDTAVNLTANNSYSIFTTGTVGGVTAFVTNDDLAAPSAGKAKVRLVNLSLDNINATLYVGSAKLDSNINYRMATSFHEVTAGTATVIVVDPTNIPAQEQLTGRQFVAGKIYTVILAGIGGGTGNAGRRLIVVENN